MIQWIAQIRLESRRDEDATTRVEDRAPARKLYTATPGDGDRFDSRSVSEEQRRIRDEDYDRELARRAFIERVNGIAGFPA